VTDAYRLGKRGRLRTDLGGVYFNAIFSIATFGAYFVTGWEPLLIVIPIQIVEMLHQFLPFIRLDGYYIVSDLTGVPDMFARIKPTLKSLNPLEQTPHQVRALKPWVRGAVTLYVFSVVPLLLFLLGLTAINVPRILATAWDSLLLQNHNLHRHMALAAYPHVGFDALQMAVLVLPVAGLFATFWQLGWTVFVGLWKRTEGRRIRRALVAAGTAVAAFGAAYTWLPSGDYNAIKAAEAGTIGGAMHQLASIPERRPPFMTRPSHTDGRPVKPSRARRGTSTREPGSPATTEATTTTETAPSSAPTTTTSGYTSPSTTHSSTTPPLPVTTASPTRTTTWPTTSTTPTTTEPTSSTTVPTTTTPTASTVVTTSP
jgi:putative peptide zinc metalloprotease protein